MGPWAARRVPPRLLQTRSGHTDSPGRTLPGRVRTAPAGRSRAAQRRGVRASHPCQAPEGRCSHRARGPRATCNHQPSHRVSPAPAHPHRSAPLIVPFRRAPVPRDSSRRIRASRTSRGHRKLAPPKGRRDRNPARVRDTRRTLRPRHNTRNHPLYRASTPHRSRRTRAEDRPARPPPSSTGSCRTLMAASASSRVTPAADPTIARYLATDRRVRRPARSRSQVRVREVSTRPDTWPNPRSWMR